MTINFQFDFFFFVLSPRALNGTYSGSFEKLLLEKRKKKTGQRKHGMGKRMAGPELLEELISASLLKVSFKA